MTNQQATNTGMVIEPNRIDTFDKFLFRPFAVNHTQGLQDALKNQHVDDDRAVILAEIPSGMMVLDKAQMSYYHTAQGQVGDKPWLVCF
ncbi:MAG: hypothetical protein AAF629_01520 [Chloroflexota bacterium]